ncbi:tetratricopeptide repeat protein [Melittangium boletus]|uniref:tetratricopeptide repeat protein n=1 Tax=Melittangium boletus TaxID=83453 RepID=UPI003DA367AF
MCTLTRPMFASPALLLLVTLAATSTPETFESTRARAVKAYRARNFTRACALFSRAAGLDPEHASVHVDLGQCLARRGRKAREAAAREHARAVFLARPNREPSRSSDEPTRKAAYLQLFRMGTRLAVPKPGECTALPQAPECSRVVHACGAYFNEHGSAGGVSGEAVRLALSPAAAAPRASEDPETGGLAVDRTRVLDFLPDEQVPREDAFSLALVKEAEDLAVDCAGTGACPAKVSGLNDTRCSLVLADACAGVVGVVCETRVRGKKARPEQRVGEVVLTKTP